MTTSIKSTIHTPRRRAFKNERRQGGFALASPRPMHKIKRSILKKLYARMKAENSFIE